MIKILIIIFTIMANNSISKTSDLNIFGEQLKSCCQDPLTGYFRDGNCRTDVTDRGTHTVCAIITDKFLQYTLSKGNDLISSNAYFPGLKVGDKWCLCALRWKEALIEDSAPPLDLESTNIKTLNYVKYDDLIAFDKTNVLVEHIILDLNQKKDLTVIFNFDKQKIDLLKPFIAIEGNKVSINGDYKPNLEAKYFYDYFKLKASNSNSLKYLIKKQETELKKTI